MEFLFGVAVGGAAVWFGKDKVKAFFTKAPADPVVVPVPVDKKD